jgi:hypothetical protein
VKGGVYRVEGEMEVKEVKRIRVVAVSSILRRLLAFFPAAPSLSLSLSRLPISPPPGPLISPVWQSPNHV